MATQPDDDEDDELQDDESGEDDTEGGSSDDDGEVGDGDDDGPAQVGFADEEPDKDQPGESSTIRDMRQKLRDKEREVAELRKASAPKPIEIGEKPTMAECGFDEDEFEAKLDRWKERKAAADRQVAQQDEDNRKINEAWQQDLSAFEQKKGRLDFEDRDAAIETVATSFPRPWQFAAIVKAAADPALFLYALSKSEAKRDELAKFEDPIKMAAAVARMEGAVKVTKGRKAPAPDRAQSGSASMPGGSDKQLEKLEKEADRTGDRSKLIAYKAKLKERGEKDK
jgi:hypothetical protein